MFCNDAMRFLFFLNEANWKNFKNNRICFVKLERITLNKEIDQDK